MNSFNKRAALRIAGVSVVLALIASPVAWYVAQKNAEDATVALAIEESRRLLYHFNVGKLNDPHEKEDASKAADALTGGLFDIAEIYDANGNKLAVAMTSEGVTVEAALPEHVRPRNKAASFESLRLADKRWILRVFVPLSENAEEAAIQPTGYFEGVRVVPDWQRNQMLANALGAALMVSLASLLCGGAIYPVVVHLSADNMRKAREVLDSHLSMMEALGRAIGKRDSDTGAHNFRVAWIASRIAERLGLRDGPMQSLIAGSFLHDIGKIAVPDAILHKPGELDAAEQIIMHEHVTQGEEIVTGIGWLDEAKAIVASHHEKWDGTGYPRQLSGEAIPLAARIFAVADVFDALCSRRPYKEAMTFEAAMSILEKDAGSHFDPKVMAAFQPISREIYDCLASASDEDAKRKLEAVVRQYFGF